MQVLLQEAQAQAALIQFARGKSPLPRHLQMIDRYGVPITNDNQVVATRSPDLLFEKPKLYNFLYFARLNDGTVVLLKEPRYQFGTVNKDRLKEPSEQPTSYKIETAELGHTNTNMENSRIALRLITNEFSILRRLQEDTKHPNIVRLVGLLNLENTDEERFIHDEIYLATEAIDGVTLGELLESTTDNNQRLELLRQMVDICDALDHIHSNKIYFRDLHPGNIMIAVEGGGIKPYIIDFGISRDFSCFKGMEFWGEAIQRPDLIFVAPEEIDCSYVSTKSDIYSLGIIIQEIIKKTSLANNTDLDFLIRRCTHRNQFSRPTAQEVKKELQNILPYLAA